MVRGHSNTSTLKRSTAVAATLIVLVIAILGTSLALQGWKSRTPGFDALLDIDGAHELVRHQRLPEVSSLNSFAVYNPPGGSWLTLPGVLVFKDPRLFGAASILLYVGTLIGIFLLARIFFGVPTATLAVALYGLSELGLLVADSLWSRYPIHFFYVWMVYWTVQWVRKRNCAYLAAALVTLAMGMFVFLEIAPALFIVPVVWWCYRPPLRLRPILLAGILAIAIWFPYLKLEYGRNFSDLRSTIGRRSGLTANYRETWCNPALTLVNLEGAPGSSAAIPDQTANAPGGAPTGLLSHLLPLWERSHMVLAGLSSNFQMAARIPGLSVTLGLLLLVSLSILTLSGTSKQATDSFELRCSFWLLKIGIGMIAGGVLWNEFLVAHFLSPHGMLQQSTISAIRWLQAILILGGIGALTLRRGIATFAHWLLNRTAVPAEARTAPAQHSVNPRLLVLSLIVPWALLFAFVENAGRLDRLWWLWPLQCVILAAIAIYIPRRLGMPRVVACVASILLIAVLSANSFLLSRVEAWHENGWSGSDPAEVQVVDYVASQSNSHSRTAIGYQLYIWQFMAVFHASDPRYKVGADMDLLFRDRSGISNSNQCAEGFSPADEFRIVQIKPGWTDFRGKGYFEVPPNPGFHFLKQFGLYQVFKRDSALNTMMTNDPGNEQSLGGLK